MAADIVRRVPALQLGDLRLVPNGQQYYIFVETAPQWFRMDGVLGRFGSTRGEAIGRYADFVLAGMGLPSV